MTAAAVYRLSPLSWCIPHLELCATDGFRTHHNDIAECLCYACTNLGHDCVWLPFRNGFSPHLYSMQGRLSFSLLQLQAYVPIAKPKRKASLVVSV